LRNTQTLRKRSTPLMQTHNETETNTWRVRHTGRHTNRDTVRVTERHTHAHTHTLKGTDRH